MAGMAKMKWRIFLFYNFTGSAVYVVSYILIGYFFGRRWILLKAWMGPTALYMILAGLALVAIVVVWRRYFPKLFAGLLPLKRKRR